MLERGKFFIEVFTEVFLVVAVHGNKVYNHGECIKLIKERETIS